MVRVRLGVRVRAAAWPRLVRVRLRVRVQGVG